MIHMHEWKCIVQGKFQRTVNFTCSRSHTSSHIQRQEELFKRVDFLWHLPWDLDNFLKLVVKNGYFK